MPSGEEEQASQEKNAWDIKFVNHRNLLIVLLSGKAESSGVIKKL
jgi:hypothetical protein